MDTYTGKNLEEALKIAADKKGCTVGGTYLYSG